MAHLQRPRITPIAGPILGEFLVGISVMMVALWLASRISDAAAGAFGLMAALPRATWIRFLIWLAIGLVIYFAYSRQHSRVGRASG